MKEDVLVAFPQEGQIGLFNVWTYSGGRTRCLAWGIKANSPDEAVKKAKAVSDG